SVPLLLLGGEDAAAVLAHLGLSLELAFDEENDLTVGRRSKSPFRLVLKTEVKKAKALNVVAGMPGRSSKLKKQAIVFSCHMDHLGKSADGKAFYGADDNASGCTTVLEIAEAFTRLAPGERPKRSILFLAVSGEELGLWGSSHYVSNPTWPLGQIVGDINMDMLGRNTTQIPKDTIRVTPSYRHNAYSSLAREAAWLGGAFGMKMANGDRFYQRSDHYNFAKKGIPIVFFCDDEHADYHMTTDTPDKLDYHKLETVARLAFLIGYRAGNRSARPEKLGSRKSWLEGD
ncbi:MAG: M28 family metallopeptidase, partial [Planctomycetota bacterium]